MIKREKIKQVKQYRQKKHLNDETTLEKPVNSFASQVKRIHNIEASLGKPDQPPLLWLPLQSLQEQQVQLPREQQAGPI